MMTPKMREATVLRVSAACRQLFLSSRMAERCSQEATQRQLEFVLDLLEDEIATRDENRKARLFKRAGFPSYKAFDGYEYNCVRFPPAFDRQGLEQLSFVPGKRNLVLYGPVGIGKTHMAIAAGVKACSMGYKTKFFTVTELVLKLAEARKNATLERLLGDLRELDLLILDEWGYVPVDKDGSQLLFRVISDSYESKSLILTTNLEFSKWGGIFTDDQMAAAMIDRLVHHGHLLIFEGLSYRMEHALMRQDAPDKRQEVGSVEKST
jgi:DNA replication protein DnaC